VTLRFSLRQHCGNYLLGRSLYLTTSDEPLTSACRRPWAGARAPPASANRAGVAIPISTAIRTAFLKHKLAAVKAAEPLPEDQIDELKKTWSSGRADPTRPLPGAVAGGRASQHPANRKHPAHGRPGFDLGTD
jgi:hypothetical protein